jgi:predicted RNase H-like HicB family nuclease
VKVREMIKVFEKDGWRQFDTRGVIGSSSTREDRKRHSVSKLGQGHTIGNGSQNSLSIRCEGRATMISCTIIIERAGTNFSAYAPDVPGCIVAADTVEDVTTLMQEAIALHIELMRESGEEVREPGRASALPLFKRLPSDSHFYHDM